MTVREGGNEGVGRRVEGCISTPIPNYLSTLLLLTITTVWRPHFIGEDGRKEQCGEEEKDG